MMRDPKISHEWFFRARETTPGGVNSPVRAARSVGTWPLFIEKAVGCRIYDLDGNEYIDYVGSWGPLILGHAHPQVIAAVQEAAEKGTSYGAPTRAEVEMAETIVRHVPSVEMVRLVSSGTEATMSAVRLARAYTQRPLIVKFDGCYHGHGDGFLIQAGSGIATLGIPGSPGIPEAIASLTLSLPYNDVGAVARTFEKMGEQIAAVIVEPVAGNMGVVLPKPGFLEGLREITSRYGALLIFDEVITGFRVALGGAQALFGVMPDLTCLGKILGGGLPLAAYGGKKRIMQHIAPEGPVYQAGTLSGNPLATAAGLTVLKILSEPGIYEALEEKSALLFQGLEESGRRFGIPVRTTRLGSMGTLFFSGEEIKDYESVKRSSTETYARFYREMRARGVYLAPSAFEAWFVSLAHGRSDVELTLTAAEEVFALLAGR